MNRATLLAFDFDGTLAPICADPAAVRLPARAAALLQEASQMRGVAVAIVSGRDADDLFARTQFTTGYVVGSHGLEVRAPGGVVIRDTQPLDLPIPHDLDDAIADCRLRVERKKHAIALHWRGRDFESIEPVVTRFRNWISSHELDVIDGRCVLEGRLRGGGKEQAIRWLASAIGASRVFYAGDDTTDLEALRFAAENGCGVFIANDERTPPAGVTVVHSFRQLFRLVRQEVLI